jgi:hypothetical protein
MMGVITNREVLRHGATIVREFGPAAYGRCILALVTGRPRTFLAAIQGRRASGTRGWRGLKGSASAVLAVLLGRASLEESDRERTAFDFRTFEPDGNRTPCDAPGRVSALRDVLGTLAPPLQ